VLDGDRLIVTATPVPLTLIICGLVAALSVIARVAVRLPSAPGVNFRLIEQVAEPARLAPHVLVCEKSPGLAPMNPMVEIVSGNPPPLVSIIAVVALEFPSTTLPKLIGEFELKFAVGGVCGEVPVPER
jgi:hypothetical protein